MEQPMERNIWIYGNPDKSELGFPMPGDLTQYLKGDIFAKEKGRYPRLRDERRLLCSLWSGQEAGRKWQSPNTGTDFTHTGLAGWLAGCVVGPTTFPPQDKEGFFLVGVLVRRGIARRCRRHCDVCVPREPTA